MIDASLLQQHSIPVAIFAAIVTLGIFFLSMNSNASKKAPRVNHKVKLDSAKVVDTVKCADMETYAQYKDGKVVMCRCWKSEKFPYCDGAHTKHNEQTGDNVGPLIIQK
jgi:CDGSH-type Zn-finger protein